MAKIKKLNFKSKKTWKSILIIGLAIITLIGAVIGITALFRKSEEKTTKEINPTYAIGGLNEDGTYLETKESIYTKDAFECKGLNVKLAFDNNISYRIFFYDFDDNFVSSTGKLTTNYSEDIDLFVKSARIVITPNEDSKISWYEKSGYAKQLTISVDKEQPQNFLSSLKKSEVNVKMLGAGTYGATGFYADGSCPFYFFDKIDVSSANTLYLKVKNETVSTPISYIEIEFIMPLLYDSDNPSVDVSTSGNGYKIVSSDNQFTIVSFDVSGYNSVLGAVDIYSVDFVELYLI